MGEVRVRVVPGGTLQQIADEWERCRRSVDLPRPEDRLDELVRTNGPQVHAMVAEDGDRIVGVLPFVEDRWQRPWKVRLPNATRTLVTVPLTRARVTSEVVLGDQTDVVAGALIEGLLAGSPTIDVVALPQVRVGSSLDRAGDALDRQTTHRLRVAEGAPKDRLLIRLDDDLDGYLANQGGRRYRGDLRRDQRRAGEQGLKAELVTEPDDVGAFLEAAAHVWSESWQSERSGPLPTDGRTLAEVSHAAERGWFRGYLLRDADGDAVCFLWMLSADGVLRSVKTAFSPAWASLSPGKVLLHQAVVDAHAEGVRLVDFGYGDYPYKRRWANDRLSTRSTLLLRPAVRPMVACLPPAGYRRARAAAIHGLQATGLEDRARRFSSRRLGR